MSVKKFFYVQPNKHDEWKHTQSIFKLITMASNATLKKMTTKPPSPVRIKLDEHETITAIFDASEKGGVSQGEAFHITQIDLSLREFACECKKHEFGDFHEPCKHVVAALVATVRFCETHTSHLSVTEVIDVAVAQDRFVGSHRKPWEWRPEFTTTIANAHGFRVERTFIRGKNVKGYRELVRDSEKKVSRGKLWRGPLPIPSPGEEVLVTLPKHDEPSLVKVVDRWDDDFHFIGLRCHFVGDPPEGYSGSTIVFGADITRPRPV